MAVGRRLLHAPPFRFVGAGQDRRRVSKGPRGHGRRFAHRHLQQALGRGIPDVALATGDVRHAMEFFIRQADVKIQAQRFGHAGHNGLARATPVGTAQ
ncbi:hypothetical protein D3C84_659330 [compost metagenome]